MGLVVNKSRQVEISTVITRLAPTSLLTIITLRTYIIWYNLRPVLTLIIMPALKSYAESLLLKGTIVVLAE